MPVLELPPDPHFTKERTGRIERFLDPAGRIPADASWWERALIRVADWLAKAKRDPDEMPP